jgi:quinol monooxygenase YgiN
MFMRTTSFKIDPAKLDAFRAEAEPARANVKALKGLVQNYVAMQASGEVMAVAIWESEAAAEAGFETAKGLWAALSGYMVTKPVFTPYPTVEKLVG